LYENITAFHTSAYHLSVSKDSIAFICFKRQHCIYGKRLFTQYWQIRKPLRD